MINEDFYRLAIFLLLITAFAVSAGFRYRAKRRNGRISRRVDGPRFAALSAGMLLLMLISVATYLIAPQWMAWAQLPALFATRTLGLLIAGLTVPGFVWLFAHIGDNISPTAAVHTKHQLVTSGPYRWVRHPLYTFGSLFWLGIGLAMASWWLLLLTTAVIPFLVARVPPEEAALLQRFGDEYRRYCRQTGRFLPLLRRVEI